MNEASGQWTLGVLIGLPILGIVTVIVILGGIGLTLFWFSEEGWFGGLLALGATLLVWALVTGISLFCYWPLKAEYHQYRPVSGVVATTNSRLIASDTSGGGSNQKFVFTLVGTPQQYGVNDTRAAATRPGDTVHLRCVRSYEYGSNNAGYDCKWGK
jgi:hypothetical protein